MLRACTNVLVFCNNYGFNVSVLLNYSVEECFDSFRAMSNWACVWSVKWHSLRHWEPVELHPFSKQNSKTTLHYTLKVESKVHWFYLKHTFGSTITLKPQSNIAVIEQLPWHFAYNSQSCTKSPWWLSWPPFSALYVIWKEVEEQSSLWNFSQ